MDLDQRTSVPSPRTADVERCPHCAGAVRPGAPWCTQCWTDLRPPPPVAPAEQAAARAPAHARVGPADDVPDDLAPPLDREWRSSAGWPCSTCGAVNAVERDDCGECGTGFLAGLRGLESPLLVLPGVGDVTALSRGQRIALAAALAAVIVLLVAVLGLVSG